MVQCCDCGKPCGRRHSNGWMNNSEFLCDSCARKRASNGIKAFGGFLFLLFAVLLSVVVALFVLKPIAMASGYDTAKSVAIGIGVSGVVLYFILRYIAGKATGCLFRMLVKLIGFLLYTLGVGMLFITFLLEDQFKGLVGLERGNSNVSTEEVQQQ